MEIESLISNPHENTDRYYLMKTFKCFSHTFSLDLCHDFSFWNAETARCIPKELHDNQTKLDYTFPPLCNRTEFDCLNAKEEFRKYCPNKDKNCESYSQENHFFCNKSKTCIPKGKLIFFAYT